MGQGRRAADDARTVWLFDLDNTLYPAESGLFGAVDERINRFLETHLGVCGSEADELRRRDHDAHGITLVGLMAEHRVDPDRYLDFVHDVPVRDYLAADPELRTILAALPGRRAIFTNGSHRHATAVVRALDLEGLFEAVFDIVALGYRPKPDPETYRTVLTRLGAAPRHTVLLEDLERNLAPARELGMQTVLVGAATPSASADFAIPTVKDLPSLLPLLA